MEKRIHVIAFNTPYPADYGGVIDIYYKIKALYDSGVKVILHSFQYNRKASPELNSICEKVYYYNRKMGFRQNLHILPFIIFSRRSKDLIRNLEMDHDPVIFEGLHSCFYLNHPSLKDRVKLVRMHNIEHHYYFGLAKTKSQLFKRIYYLIEALKLRLAQGILKKADFIAAISQADLNYLDKKYQNVFLLNPFHSNNEVTSKSGRGDYILYHANLSVPENYIAAGFLIDKVFKELDFPVKIAGKNPDKRILNALKTLKGIELISNPGNEEMHDLVRNAQAIVLFTFQSTGIKLKLIDSLYQSRFVIVNQKMAGNTGLEDSCIIANSPEEIIIAIRDIISTSYSKESINEKKALLQAFNPSQGAKLLCEKLFS